MEMLSGRGVDVEVIFSRKKGEKQASGLMDGWRDAELSDGLAKTLNKVKKLWH